MIFLFWIFNYFDQRAIEKVKVEYVGQELTFFNLGLKLFQFFLLYGMYFFFAKSIQFVTSLFFKISIEDVPMGYYSIPILVLMEIGLSKLNFANITNLLLYISRATIKFGVISGIDKLLIAIFK